MSENKIVTAIGFHCKGCQVEVGCTHAYVENHTLYVQGVCSECGEAIRFSCDQLLSHLLVGQPSHKGNNSVN